MNMILGGVYTGYNGLVASPFPDLDPIFQMRLPLYDFKDSLKANDENYTDLIGYIGLNVQADKSNSVWYGILCGASFVGAIGLLVWSMAKADRKSVV